MNVDEKLKKNYDTTELSYHFSWIKWFKLSRKILYYLINPIIMSY